MYISRLVKTRTPILVFFNRYPVSSIPLSDYPRVLSSSSHLLHLYSHLSYSLHLLLVYLSGSAATPSHLQRGPSVTIPSVRRS
jgi:hypothetical protein